MNRRPRNFPRSRAITVAVALAATVASAAAIDWIPDVRVFTWDLAVDSTPFPPETADRRVRVHWLDERASFALAFSGGGTRSATATLGQLRALDHLGWIERARYISANSGGTWTTVPYTYLPAPIADEVFLGPLVEPEEINDQILEPDSDSEHPHSMARVLHQSTTGDKISSALKGDEAYADIVGRVFLEPFGLHDRSRFFTFDAASLQRIVAANPDLSPESFYTITHGRRPFPILVGTMLGKQRGADADEYHLLEMTPLYVGVARRGMATDDDHEFPIGGGYVEPLGYDSQAPRGAIGDDERWTVRLRGKVPFSGRYRFTLSDAIGVSSAAPAVTLAGKYIPNLGFPEFRHWPVSPADRGATEARELKHGDGGDIDNLAVLPLLARGVENLLVFVNTRQRFEPGSAHCGSVSEEHLTDDLVSLFEPTERLQHNVVLAGGQTKLRELCDAFSRRRVADEPLVHCDTYAVLEKEHLRTRSYEAAICWAYLDGTDGWLKRLAPDGGRLTAALAAGRTPFDTFPHYETFGEKTGRVIDLDRERVNALAHLTAWSVEQSADYIREKLGGAGLP